MVQNLVAAELIEQAQDATQLQNFDSYSFREGLDVFLSDFNNTELRKLQLHDSGLISCRFWRTA